MQHVCWSCALSVFLVGQISPVRQTDRHNVDRQPGAVARVAAKGESCAYLLACHNACYGRASRAARPQLSQLPSEAFSQERRAMLPRPRGDNPAPSLTHTHTHTHLCTHMYTPSTRMYMLERFFFFFFFQMTQIDTSAHGRGAAQLRNHMQRSAIKQPRLTLDVQVLIDSTWASVKRWGKKKTKQEWRGRAPGGSESLGWSRLNGKKSTIKKRF